jgi:flagellar motor switch protein FliG
VSELSGSQKAAVLLLQMDRESSARVLANMRETEVEEITAEIMRMQQVGAEVADDILDEFHTLATARRYTAEGGIDFARDLLEATLGAEKAAEMVGRLQAAVLAAPFQFIYQVDVRQVLTVLQHEHPQIIALVLAHLTAERASAILSGLSPELQTEVAHRIGVMERASPEAIRHVEDALHRPLSGVLTQAESLSAIGGIQPLVEIMNRTDRSTEKLLLESLENRDAELAEEVRSRMFMFEDIVSLDDKALQLILRQVETTDLATALKGVRDEVREKVTSNISERAAQNLAEETDLLGPVRLRLIEESRAKVVRVIRSLEESGDIVLRRSGDDELVA